MPRLERKIPGVPDRKGINPFTRQTMVIPGRKPKLEVFEIEQDGATLSIAQGDEAAGDVRITKKVLDSEEEAAATLTTLVKKRLRRGFTSVGPARTLRGDTEERPPVSFIWLEQAFAGEDEKFLSELFRFAKPDKVASFAAAWIGDRRPFARRALLAYVDDGCDRPGHKALVKRLFKQAEQSADDELMAHFMVAFDRLVKRTRTVRRGQSSFAFDPLLERSLPKKKSSVQFSIVTRRYLVRRAWRYFRVLGHKDVARHGRAIRYALGLYEDAHLSQPMRLLDAWGFANALYGGSDILEFSPKGITLADGHTLASLSPKPRFPQAFDGCFGELVPLLARAGSRPVRRFLKDKLEATYAKDLAALTIPELRELLASPHEEPQALGAKLLKTAKGAAELGVDAWLSLLEVPSLEIVALLCEAIAQHVTPARLSLEQAAELARSKRAPVAELGKDWLLAKAVRTEADLSVLLGALRAPIESVRRALTTHVESLLVKSAFAGPTHLRELVDAPFPDARSVGLALLEREAKFRESPVVWWALAESPWKDVRDFATAHTKTWLANASAADAPKAARFYATTLLSVHGGSKGKRRAMRDLAAHAAAPREAVSEADVLALVRHVARSVRRAERAMALSALARALHVRPDLADRVRELLPEVTFTGAVTQ